MKFVDPDGRAFGFEVDDENQVININVDIYIYGKAADITLAEKFQKAIENEWNKEFHYDYQGKSYSVNFNVNVKVCNPIQRFNPFNKKSDAYIAISNNPYSTSRVNSSTTSGQWRGVGYGGFSIDSDNPAPHEFGHILGFTDYYDKSKNPMPGWEGNIMGEVPMAGIVEQKNIDTLCNAIVQTKRKVGYICPRNFPY